MLGNDRLCNNVAFGKVTKGRKKHFPMGGNDEAIDEIRLRAIRNIGELSRELEKAPPIRGDLLPVDGKKMTKEQRLADVGISTSAAQRYEELAGPREE